MLLTAIALGAEPAPPLPARGVEVRRVRLKGPPTRLAMGTRLREGTDPGFHVEGSVQVLRSRWVTVEAVLAGAPNHALDLPGPWRTLASVDGAVDLALEPSPWLAIGPSVGVAYRMFGQQGILVQDAWTPTVGGAIGVQFVRGRTWGFALAGRALADVGSTQLVLQTAAVEALSPVEVSVALEARFGHGREPTAEGSP